MEQSHWNFIYVSIPICVIFLGYLIHLMFKNEIRGPKGEKLTKEVIQAYKEQDELDKESVFDSCR